MLEMQITIEAAGLAAAINNLAAAISGKNAETLASAPLSSVASAAVTTQTPAASAAAPAPASVVPTAAPQYTLDMIATAGSALIDAGKMEQLIQLLSKFGVASLTELPPDKYGAVAAELRGLGAAI